MDVQKKGKENLVSMDAKVNQSFSSIDEVVSVLDGLPINVMCCDRDLIIKYMNPSSFDTLAKLEHYLPIPVSKVVGSNIDIFHKNPGHQQRILSSERNLPLNTIIEVGPEKLDLMVNPIINQHREYVGAVVTWDIVTEKLKQEADLARIESMVEGAPFNIMCADLEGTIQYLNPKSISTLRSIEGSLPKKVDDIKGGSYDVFHRNPSNVRKILASEGNLPHQAIIQVGSDKLDLYISPMKDADGKYIGPM